MESLEKRRRVLAVASGGGHWIQLQRLMPAFADADVTYVTTLKSYRAEVDGSRFYTVRDANRLTRLRLVWLALRMVLIVLRERPEIVISTGAAPGYFAIRAGKLVGARTIWVDSMANAEQLSLSGQRIKSYADVWLTQWPHLATPDGPFFAGAVL